MLLEITVLGGGLSQKDHFCNVWLGPIFFQLCPNVCPNMLTLLILLIKCSFSEQTYPSKQEGLFFLSTELPWRLPFSTLMKCFRLNECFTLCHHCLVWVTPADALFAFNSQSLIPAQAERERERVEYSTARQKNQKGRLQSALQIRIRQIDGQSAKGTHHGWGILDVIQSFVICKLLTL